MAFFAGFGGLMEIRACAPEMVSKAAGENRGRLVGEHLQAFFPAEG
jgi:hypothetical protein